MNKPQQRASKTTGLDSPETPAGQKGIIDEISSANANATGAESQGSATATGDDEGVVGGSTIAILEGKNPENVAVGAKDQGEKLDSGNACQGVAGEGVRNACFFFSPLVLRDAYHWSPW